MKEIMSEYNEKLLEVMQSINPSNLDSDRTDTERIRRQVTEVYISKLFERLDSLQPGLGKENEDKIKEFMKNIEFE